MAGQRRRCWKLERMKLAADIHLIYEAVSGGPQRHIWLRPMELRSKEQQHPQDLDLA
jgi:hypothetical protein